MRKDDRGGWRSIISAFRSDLVRVQGRTTGADQGTDTGTAASAEQPADDSTGTCADGHVDHIAVPPVEAGPTRIRVVSRLIGRVIDRLPVRSSAVVVAAIVRAGAVACVSVAVIG